MEKRCCFCGHRDASNEIITSLKEKIEYLITQKEVNQFYIGEQGNFDQLSIKTLYHLKKKYQEIHITTVLAYFPNHKKEHNSDTLYPEGLELIPPKYAILYRNRWMIDHSDYMIAYVHRSYGGAAKMLSYAQQKKLLFFLYVKLIQHRG